MGYQESMLFCDNKKELKKLCRVLNSAKPEFEDYVDIYAIGKLKKPIGIRDISRENVNFIFQKTLTLFGGVANAIHTKVVSALKNI